MLLLDLPNDLLRRIISYLQGRELSNLINASKYIFDRKYSESFGAYLTAYKINYWWCGEYPIPPRINYEPLQKIERFNKIKKDIYDELKQNYVRALNEIIKILIPTHIHSISLKGNYLQTNQIINFSLPLRMFFFRGLSNRTMNSLIDSKNKEESIKYLKNPPTYKVFDSDKTNLTNRRDRWVSNTKASQLLYKNKPLPICSYTKHLLFNRRGFRLIRFRKKCYYAYALIF